MIPQIEKAQPAALTIVLHSVEISLSVAEEKPYAVKLRIIIARYETQFDMITLVLHY